MGTDGLKKDSWREKTCYPANCMYTRCRTCIMYDEAWKIQDFFPLGWRKHPSSAEWCAHGWAGRSTQQRALIHWPGTNLTRPFPLALPSPPHGTSNDYRVLHHSPGRGCHIPTHHKSIVCHLHGARTGRERPPAMPNRLPHWCCHDGKGWSRATLLEKPGWGGEMGAFTLSGC